MGCANPLDRRFGDYVPIRRTCGTIAIREIQDVLKQASPSAAVVEFLAWAIARGLVVRRLNKDLIVLINP